MDRPILKEFVLARANITDAITSFPPQKRFTRLFKKWTIKDLLAHLSGWDIYTLDAVLALKSGRIPPWGEAVDRFNLHSVAKREKWLWPRVYREFVSVGHRLEKELRSVPPEKWNKKIWPNKSFTLEKLLKIDIDHYLNEHLPEIKKLSDKR